MIGIYKITNNITGNFYIGSSNDIERRWKEHKTPSQKNKNKLLFEEFKKYGLKNFDFSILEICNVEDLFKKEEYYIALLKPTYNKNKGGKGNKGHKVSEDTKKVLSDFGKLQWKNKTEEEKQKIINNNLKGPSKGHIVSNTTKEKLRKANLGKKQSIETIEKRRLILKTKLIGNKNGNKRIAMIDIESLEVVKEFESIKKASEFIGARPEMISVVLKGKRKKTKGYYWKYL